MQAPSKHPLTERGFLDANFSHRANHGMVEINAYRERRFFSCIASAWSADIDPRNGGNEILARC